ncbi:hypothetical protein ACFL2Q_03820 [Thermodesulfobacteriota bacterium]
MRKLVALLVIALPLIAWAEGKPLPRSLDAFGIPVAVALDSDVPALKSVKGDFVRSGRFMTIDPKNGRQLSVTLDPKEKRAIKIVIRVKEDEFNKIVKKAKDLYSEGNQYATEKQKRYESHIWKDKNTIVKMICSRKQCRLELENREE